MRYPVLLSVAAGTLSLVCSVTSVPAQTSPQTAAQAAPATTSDPAAAARAMVTRAVEAVQRDKQKALLAFTRGGEGFRQADLYVFCFGPDGKIDAHPNPELLGIDGRILVDRTGKHFAAEMLEAAKPGAFLR